MPHRLLHLFPYPITFFVGLGSGTASFVLAAFTPDSAAAMGMAIVALGAVLAQPLMRVYDGYRERKRANDAADRAQQTGEFEIEVRRRVELEAEVERLKAQNADQQEQIDKLRKGAGKAVKEIGEKADEALSRVAAVEAQQGSTSGHFPAAGQS